MISAILLTLIGVYAVPASNVRMLQKSLSSESDALIYDLEDSVAPSEKARARSSLLEFLTVSALPFRLIEALTTLRARRKMKIMPNGHSSDSTR